MKQKERVIRIKLNRSIRNSQILLPIEPIQTIQKVLEHGEKTNKKSWDKSITFHLYRAVRHIVLYIIGSKSEPHLEHALTRMIIAVDKQSKQKETISNPTYR